MSNIQNYVQQLNSLSSSTSKSIIDTAAVIVEAKRMLSKDDYHDFLNQTKYNKDSSAIRKLEVIGNAKVRLETVSHLLPASWTTIYKIASLPTRDFQILVERELLHPLVKASEIDTATKIVQPKPQKMLLTLELDSCTDADTAVKLIDDIKALKPNYLFQIKLCKKLEDFINSTNIKTII